MREPGGLPVINGDGFQALVSTVVATILQASQWQLIRHGRRQQPVDPISGFIRFHCVERDTVCRNQHGAERLPL